MFSKNFKKSLRGYDVSEVNSRLDLIDSAYDKLIKENKHLIDKIKSLQADIEIYKENEANLQKAIIKSQELAEEIINNAKKKAELITKEAELNLRKQKQDIDNEIISKQRELNELKEKNENLIEEVRNYLNEKLIELEDFLKNRKIYKMELTTFNTPTEDEKITDDFISESSESGVNVENDEKKSGKNNDDLEIKGKSFSDNFEII
ncbi:MAG: DivIVA domain-containing protein [Ignavibacteria bacterium]|nr:DivIVA domain-containing protein [Ignavibacteria bacterium]